MPVLRCFHGLDEIFNNLHGKVGKTVVTRILAQLADKQHIIGKTYGKQVIYVLNQVCHAWWFSSQRSRCHPRRNWQGWIQPSNNCVKVWERSGCATRLLQMVHIHHWQFRVGAGIEHTFAWTDKDKNPILGWGNSAQARPIVKGEKQHGWWGGC